MGGFVTGPKVLIDYLRQRARPFLFSSGITPADTAAAIAAVDVLLESDEPVKRLWDNAAYFQKGLKEAGFDIGKTQTPITPVMLEKPSWLLISPSFSFEKGIFAQSIALSHCAQGQGQDTLHAVGGPLQGGPGFRDWEVRGNCKGTGCSEQGNPAGRRARKLSRWSRLAPTCILHQSWHSTKA